MLFLMLWLTLGLSLLVVFGIDDVVTFISLDTAEPTDEAQNTPAYFALCLTIMVIAWPMILLDTQKRS